jgi:hypothetical protein
MKPPLTERQIARIHQHQFLALHVDTEFLKPYLCPADGKPLVARETGMHCSKCGYVNDGYIVYPGKQNITGKIVDKFAD